MQVRGWCLPLVVNGRTQAVGPRQGPPVDHRFRPRRSRFQASVFASVVNGRTQVVGPPMGPPVDHRYRPRCPRLLAPIPSALRGPDLIGLSCCAKI